MKTGTLIIDRQNRNNESTEKDEISGSEAKINLQLILHSCGLELNRGLLLLQLNVRKSK